MSSPATLNTAIQEALLATIKASTFEFELPDISETSWDALVSPADAERLEFVGDGLMHAAVGLVLHKLFPCESPHFYTVGTLIHFSNQRQSCSRRKVYSESPQFKCHVYSPDGESRRSRT